MRLPKSGRVSNQFSLSRSFTTSPNTATAGALKPVASTFSAMSAERPAQRLLPARRAPAHQRHRQSPAPRRASISCAVITPIRSTPMSITFVPGVVASCAKSSELSGLRRIFVAGENGELRRVIAMRHRDARVSRRGDRRSDARE